MFAWEQTRIVRYQLLLKSIALSLSIFHDTETQSEWFFFYSICFFKWFSRHQEVSLDFNRHVRTFQRIKKGILPKKPDMYRRYQCSVCQWRYNEVIRYFSAWLEACFFRRSDRDKNTFVLCVLVQAYNWIDVRAHTTRWASFFNRRNISNLSNRTFYTNTNTIIRKYHQVSWPHVCVYFFVTNKLITNLSFFVIYFLLKKKCIYDDWKEEWMNK